jgi:hypothetical protein
VRKTSLSSKHDDGSWRWLPRRSMTTCACLC